MGEYSLLTELGVLLRTICTPANASGRIGSTVYCLPANSTDLPALFVEARNLIDLMGKLRSESTFRIRSPTAPVAPTTATFTDTVTPHELENRGRRKPPTVEGYRFRCCGSAWIWMLGIEGGFWVQSF